MVERLLTAAGLAVLLCVAFPGVLFGGRTLSSSAWVPGVLPQGPVGAIRPPGPPPVRDVEGASWVDEPAPYLVGAEIGAGRLPLWNDREGLGMPLLGNPNMGALSPLQWPVNLFPSAWVQDLAWIGRAFLLGLFTFGLARELGAGRLGAFAAAAALMLSGQTVEWIEHHPLNTDVFVPAALWAALSIPRTGRRGLACLALAVGAGLLGVKPQSALVGGLFGLVLVAAVVRDRRGAAGPAAPQRLGRLYAISAVGVVLGMAVAAAALLPFAETYGQASGLVRAGRTTQSDWALPLAALPGLGGAVATAVGRLLAGAGAGAPSLVGLPYAGLGVIGGALLGLGATRASWTTRVLAITAGVEILRIHGLLPVPLGDVPILGSINYVKYCFPLYLSLALLLARGLDSLVWPWPAIGLVLVVLELCWLVPGNRAVRVDLYAPAPWTAALTRLNEARPGRLAGPVDLAPPLVSSALGFRDLRSIDVLTPRDTYDFVSRTVSPSLGITWILADPDPLLAATGPGANLADLRWIVAREPLQRADLPAAVRASTTARRLVRLFDDLERQRIETRALGGGLHAEAGDRRFHWTCETPCRFEFEMRRIPEHFVVGLAAAAPVALRVRLARAGEAMPTQRVAAGRAWQDLWLAGGDAAGAPGTIVLVVDADEPVSVFVGGVGPAPALDEEVRRAHRELAYRTAAWGRLSLRWSDDVAQIYENEAAFGEAVFADRIIEVRDRDDAFACVVDHAGERVACTTDGIFPAGQTPSRGTVRVEESRAARLQIRTVAPAAGVLLVSRLFAPGWQARIDGRPQPLQRVNGALMALPVPGGSHLVEIEYAARPFRLGLVVSLVALLVVAGLLAGTRRGGPAGRGPSGRGDGVNGAGAPGSAGV